MYKNCPFYMHLLTCNLSTTKTKDSPLELGWSAVLNKEFQGSSHSNYHEYPFIFLSWNATVKKYKDSQLGLGWSTSLNRQDKEFQGLSQSKCHEDPFMIHSWNAILQDPFPKCNFAKRYKDSQLGIGWSASLKRRNAKDSLHVPVR